MKSTAIVSIVVITWNSQEKLPICLDYLIKQNYPKDNIELIIVDGGSRDRTFDIYQNYRKKFLKSKLIKTKIKDPEPKRAIGFLQAQGEYIAIIDPDNYMTDKNWLNDMIAPLDGDKSLIGSQTLYYQYNKNETLTNRYFGLFGFNDPVVFYLGKADRIPHFEKYWLFNNQFIDKGNYFEVTFDKLIPTMGCNGVIFRRKQYIKAISSPQNYFHIDIVKDLVDSGLTKFAIVKNDILHSTSSSFKSSITRRVSYMGIHYLEKLKQRHYLIYDPQSKDDKKNLIKFIIYTVTVIQPLYLSIKGFIKIRDIAWFLHWPMCLGMLIAYGYVTLKNRLVSNKLLKSD